MRLPSVAGRDLALVFAPDVGGRLLSLRWHDREVLWRDLDIVDESFRLRMPRSRWPELDGTMASWTNLGGSKTWPAPQGWGGEGEWAGPPDPVLDAGVWSYAAVRSGGSTRVTMESPADARTGLRVRREFDVPDAGGVLRQTNTFENASGRPVRWSLWEVAQVDAAAGGSVLVTVPDATTASEVGLGDYDGTVRSRPVPNGFEVPVVDAVAKRGWRGATAMAYRGGGLVVELASLDPLATGYPDGGCSAELWLQYPTNEPLAALGGLHPRAALVELELLSPLHDLAPGARAVQRLEWRLGPDLGNGGTGGGESGTSVDYGETDRADDAPTGDPSITSP